MIPELRQLHSAPMSSLQTTAVVICLVINFLDGFDVLAIAFAAPEIANDWSISPSALGIIFSAGLAGMVAGALLLSPLADRIGRRPLILICLAIIGAGMLGSAISQSINHLVVARLITGLGVGGMLSSLTTMVAEYSNDRRRKLAISILQSGYPVGAIIAGIASVYLLQHFGWRSIFLVGGVLSMSMIPVVIWRLPESLEFLVTRRPPGALDRANLILKKIGLTPFKSLSTDRPPSTTEHDRGGVFSAMYIGRTIAIWIAFIMLMSAFYFVTNWTPKILTDAGLSREAGISGGVLIALGGVTGGLLLGWLSQHVAVHKIGATYMALGILAMTTFGFLTFTLSLMLPVAFLIGFFLAGAIICLYAMLPDLYPSQIRNTGAGWALGIGRLGAVIGPFVAGLLIESGWQRPSYYIALSAPLLISAAAVLWLGKEKAIARKLIHN